MNDTEFIAAEMERLMLGGTVAAPAQQQPALTFQKLIAIRDYLKPERLTVAGEEIEVYGYNVHREFNPPGITVLTEKQDPNAVTPKRGKLVIIDENADKALIYDPPEKDIEL